MPRRNFTANYLILEKKVTYQKVVENSMMITRLIPNKKQCLTINLKDKDKILG